MMWDVAVDYDMIIDREYELDADYWDWADEVDARIEDEALDGWADVNRLLELDGYLRGWVLT